MATSPDYPVLGRPRISLPGFAAVLRSGGSPAAGEATSEYNAIAAAGVDPAVALAIFRKESTYGRFGRANKNRSWGNIRGGTAYPLDDKRFRIYPSWTAGAADIGRLLAVYGSNRIRPGTKTDTVQTLPFVWAPSSDGNAPDAYGDSLARWIGEWSAKYPASGSGPPTVNADLASTGPVAPAWINDDSHVLTDADLRELKAWVIANSPPDSGALAMWLEALLFPSIAQLGQGYPDFHGKTLGELRAEAPGIFKPVTTGGLSPPGPLDDIAAAIGGIPAALGGALLQVGLFAGLIAIVLLGLYLLARSED